MNKYIRLIAKPDTWYKEGTEVYNDNGELFTLKQYEECKKDGILCCTGIRIAQTISEHLHFLGEEYIDGEVCSIDEFNIEVIDG